MNVFLTLILYSLYCTRSFFLTVLDIAMLLIFHAHSFQIMGRGGSGYLYRYLLAARA